ncbi:MAG: NAD-dependent epimerase/dehydratase family protein [Candidatus Sumerlaeia bacterium]|nr:NAD-dependent epimerase/dehydratase family protein [Candidatus Sumerlaeia bacterium]
MRVLITGSNGFLGSAICRAFLRDPECDVLALHRERADLSLVPPGSRLVVGEFHDPRRMGEVFNEFKPDAVVHAAAIVSTGVPNAAASLRYNVEGTAALLTVAREAGCQRWVQISSMSAHPENKSVYGGTKYLADLEVRKSGLDWTILRPSLIYGEVRRGIFHRLAGLLDSLPVVTLVGSGMEPVRPVHREDVAAACVSVLQRPESVNSVYMLGGPEEDWTFRSMVLEMRRIMNKSALTVPVPLPICRAMAILGEMLFEDPPLTTDNIEGLSRAQAIDTEPAIRDLAFAPRSFQEGFTSCLEAGLLKQDRKS